MEKVKEQLSMPRCDIEELKEEIKELKEIILKLKGMLSVYRISGNVSTYTNYEILALLAEAERVTGGGNDRTV